ncbi:BZ3500_MvSof-1268-A1-R1_Chr2-1g04317 [Microbotryum saponariae]|uniref:BZ3500_MvSof-1268-A1-R1_Chr2-1g04317 protein n=1 Tax=Microbotryum saponariae TaxID=289078 RepID=A0A2X0MIG1_9BASI|nr:BZ3500_MvSof-1268-A1-R1_Chr2-1g04317 [Microbotryum saponariae]SCZ91415.1 BZ3501_MvSof-1269-A2-R1_Chr2-1g03973 [Microbotryum saponariae]
MGPLFGLLNITTITATLGNPLPLDEAMALSEIEPLLELADTDKRIQGFHQLHQCLQGQNNDNGTSHSISIDDLERLIPSIKASLKHANSFLSTAALTCLPDYFARFDNVASDQNPSASTSTSTPSASMTNHLAHVLKQAFLNLLPLDKLADSKVQVRDLAKAAIVSAARTSLKLGVNAGTGPSKDKEGPWQLWEARIQELGFHSKSPKAREQALHALAALRDPVHPPLAPLRPFTTFLLPLLSDSDPTVRTLALSTTIKIFASESVTPAARADLKKAMIKLDVGKKTQETVLAAVLGGASAAEMETRSSGTNLGQARSSGPSEGAKSERSGSAHSVASRSPSTSAPTMPPGALRRPSGGPPTGASLAASLPSAAFPSDPSSVHAPLAEIQPVYMASDRDVLRELEGMKGCFEGKETEFNWIERDKSVARIRGMIKGNAPRDFLESLLVGLKVVLEGIMKTASSLRTTVAVSALSLISELASTLRHSLDVYFLDHLMSHCLSMAGGTKKLVASASQASVTSLLTHLAYHHKMLQLLWIAMNDKIVSARNFTAAHVMTFVELHAVRSKQAIEHTNGLDELEKCVKKGLQDSSLVVKETMRKVFWKLKEIWPRLGDKILAGLDGTTRKQLEKSDPSKVTTAGASAGARSVSGPALGRAAGRPSIRDMVKQAKLAKDALADGDPVDDLLVPSSSLDTTKTQSTSLPSTPLAAPAAPPPSTPPLVATPSRPPPVHAPSSTGSRRQSRIPIHSPLGSPSHLPVDQGSRSPPSRRKMSSVDGSEATNKTYNIDEVVKASGGGDSESSPVTHAAVGKKGTNGSLVLPVPEPIVDDALRDQAFQAEQAAERLLELADEDEPQSQGERAPPKDDKKTPHVPRQVDVFADSPDLRNGDGAVASATNGLRNWWMKKVDQPAPPKATSTPADTPQKIQEIDSLISSFTSDQASTSDLLKLVQVSKERPIVETDSSGDSPFSSPSHRPSPSTTTSSSTFWTNRFTLIWEALTSQLLRSPTSEEATTTKEVLLVLFKSLIEHQLVSFAGSEQDVFSTLLYVRSSDPTRSTIGAIEGIASCFCTTSEPLFSLSSLNQAMERFLSSSSTPNTTLDKSLGFSLGLRCLGTLFERLPPEVLDDVVPASLPLIKKALEAPSGEVRRSSINALTSVYKVYRDENRLWDVIGDMPQDRKNLLTYYIAKLPPA